MKKVIALFSALFLNNVYACPNIIGTWQSSNELSVKHNKENLDLEPHTIKFMNDVFGVLKITFTENVVHMHSAPTKKIEIKGKPHDFTYEELRYEYKIESCNKKTLFISDQNPYYQSKNEPITFIDKDTYWVPTMPGSDEREYFVRISKGI
ncbi:hypothetical protein KO519_20335 [Paraglaciecola agarilytica]|uniref:hypothetical protein n=1 Tax=Paraglaciecola chathamensis TaxID=368405 RepID=UPI001C09EA43|nr:hypothetical protein [Paraglaciecola agarilytica]MBU3020027.1 hypothetical protein [Paraglaciecola agarilytica]